jgi:hypothetical protein
MSEGQQELQKTCAVCKMQSKRERDCTNLLASEADMPPFENVKF